MRGQDPVDKVGHLLKVDLAVLDTGVERRKGKVLVQRKMIERLAARGEAPGRSISQNRFPLPMLRRTVGFLRSSPFATHR